MTTHLLMMALLALACLVCVNAEGHATNTTISCYNNVPGNFSCFASPGCENAPCMTSDNSAGHCKGNDNYCYKNTGKSCEECASQYSSNGGCPILFADMSNSSTAMDIFNMQNSYLGDCANRRSECNDKLGFECIRNGYYPPAPSPVPPPTDCWNGTPSNSSCTNPNDQCRGMPCRREGDLPGECGDNGRCEVPLVCQASVGNNTCLTRWECAGKSCDITAALSGTCYQGETKCGDQIDCKTCAEGFFHNGGCPNMMGDPALFDYGTYVSAQVYGCAGREKECGYYVSMRCMSEGYGSYSDHTNSNNGTANCTPPEGLSDLVMQSDIHCQTDSDCHPLRHVITPSEGFWCWKDQNHVGKCGPEGAYPGCIGACIDACNLDGEIQDFSSTQCECIANCNDYSMCNSEEKRTISHVLKTCHFPDPFAPPSKLKCGGGQFVQSKNVKDMEHCMECPPGTYSKPSTYRNKKCKKCRRGSVAPVNGTTQCTKCPKGMTHNNPRTECIDIAATPQGTV